MDREKLIDLIVLITLATLTAIAVFNDWLSTYKGFVFIPVLAVYYLGKYIGKQSENTKNKG